MLQFIKKPALLLEIQTAVLIPRAEHVFCVIYEAAELSRLLHVSKLLSFFICQFTPYHLMSLRVCVGHAANRKEFTVAAAFLLSTRLLLFFNQGIPEFPEKGEFDFPRLILIVFIVDASSSFLPSQARGCHP